jgi:hypothetical protein
MPRAGRTTVRIDEQLSNVAGGIFGGILGGGGGGIGGATMGSIMAQTHQPLLGLAAWASIFAAAYGAARFTIKRVAAGRREKLHELAQHIADQIAESLRAAEPTDPKKRLGNG